MSDFFVYVFSAFWPKWWPVVTIGSLLGLDAFVTAFWPWGKRKLDRIPHNVRFRLEITLLFISVFYAGYAAWSEDHASLVKATNDLGIVSGERDEARRQGGASPAQQSTINRLSGDLAGARGQIDDQKGTISKLQTELEAVRSLYAARHLSDEQKQTIQERAKVPSDEKYSLSVFQPADCRDCNEYSTELIETLTAPSVGWTVAVFTTVHGGINPRFRGLALVVRDPTNAPKSAHALANALTSAQIQFAVGKAEGTLNVAEDAVGILIGPKEGQ
jgi:hypothetical protein